MECVAGLPWSPTAAWVQPVGGSSRRSQGWKRGVGLELGRGFAFSRHDLLGEEPAHRPPVSGVWQASRGVGWL